MERLRYTILVFIKKKMKIDEGFVHGVRNALALEVGVPESKLYSDGMLRDVLVNNLARDTSMLEKDRLDLIRDTIKVFDNEILNTSEREKQITINKKHRIWLLVVTIASFIVSIIIYATNPDKASDTNSIQAFFIGSTQAISMIGLAGVALYEPFGFSLLLSFLAMFFYLYAYEPIHAGKGWKNAIVTWYQKFKESVFFRKLFFLAFVTSLILFRTLLNRQMWMNPLSDVMGGWGIWETVNGEQKLTTECIENVIMMVPFSAVVAWTFGEKIGNDWKKILWQSGKIAFSFSVSIEMLQLLLRLGTFQLSDIFYNTVGGVLGGLLYCVAMKARKRLPVPKVGMADSE